MGWLKKIFNDSKNDDALKKKTPAGPIESQIKARKSQEDEEVGEIKMDAATVGSFSEIPELKESEDSEGSEEEQPVFDSDQPYGKNMK